MILALPVTLSPDDGHSTQASAALPPPLRADVGVLWAVRVAVRAVSHARVPSRWPIAAKVVDLLRNRFQVVRPNTVPNPAQVIDRQAIWDRRNTELVSPAMGIDLISRAIGNAANPEASVAVREALSRPQPTGVGELHLRPKADSRINGFGAKASWHSSIVTPMPVT